MATAIKAVYEDGVFKPTEPVKLKEHTEVQVLVPVPAEPQATDDPTGWKALRSLTGIIEDAPADMAESHDHYLYLYLYLYLYGFPRR